LKASKKDVPESLERPTRPSTKKQATPLYRKAHKQKLARLKPVCIIKYLKTILSFLCWLATQKHFLVRKKLTQKKGQTMSGIHNTEMGKKL